MVCPAKHLLICHSVDLTLAEAVTMPGTVAQVTLSGIFFVPDESEAVALDLQNGWTNQNTNTWGTATYVPQLKFRDFFKNP